MKAHGPMTEVAVLPKSKYCVKSEVAKFITSGSSWWMAENNQIPSRKRRATSEIVKEES